MLICVACAIASQLIGIGIIQEIAVYNVFFIAGYVFYKNMTLERLAALALFSFLFTLSLLAYEMFSKGSVTPMQTHKFPPDFTFLCYNAFALCLVSLIVMRSGTMETGLPKTANWLIDLWNKRGFTIYLYQNCVYFAFAHLVPQGFYHTPWFIVNISVAALSILILSTALSYITYSFERWCFRIVIKR